MTSDDGRVAKSAADLRGAFDRSFAEMPGERVALVEDLLAIRVGADPFALRLRDLSGLFADRPVVPLPTSVSGFLGIAGFRGALVPVYDLPTLLGYPATDAPRWLAVARRESAVGLAFAVFEGWLHAATHAIAPRSGRAAAALVHEAISAEEVVRPVVHVPAVLDEIARRLRPGASQQER